jgi:COMPASS component SWD1
LQNDPQIVATYDQRGKHIYTGNSKGKILVVANVKDKEGEKEFKTVACFKVTSQNTTAIKSIEFARRTKSFLVNTADRVIRVYKTTEVLKLKKGSP